MLITGAASGMGRLMAHRLAAKGAVPVLVDLDKSGLDRVAREIKGAPRFVCDVSRRAQVSILRQWTLSEVGQIDILVNNAGVISTGAYREIPEGGDERMIAVNAAGVHWMTKTFLADLIASEEGHLVMMASIAAMVGVPYQALYSATKWFVAGLGESIRQELRADGHGHVHVTIVHPSIVGTGFYAGRVEAPRLLPILRPDRVVERTIRAVERNRPYVREPLLVKTVPLLRGVLPARAADAVSRLLGTHRVVPRTPR